jgi:hypothetical protein
MLRVKTPHQAVTTTFVAGAASTEYPATSE